MCTYWESPRQGDGGSLPKDSGNRSSSTDSMSVLAWGEGGLRKKPMKCLCTFFFFFFNLEDNGAGHDSTNNDYRSKQSDGPVLTKRPTEG